MTRSFSLPRSRDDDPDRGRWLPVPEGHRQSGPGSLEIDDAMPCRLIRRSETLHRLFDSELAASEYRATGSADWLLRSERSALGVVSGKRIREFAAGRACARHALGSLGHSAVALPPLPDRRPCWPSDVVGSISHTRGFSGAVVASTRTHRAVGIDVEVAVAVTPDVWSYVLTTKEQERLEAVADPAARQSLAAICFSAKEAFYKCQYTLTQRWLDFHDVAVEIDTLQRDEGAFQLRCSVELPELGGTMPIWSGRYQRLGPWVFTGVALRR